MVPPSWIWNENDSLKAMINAIMMMKILQEFLIKYVTIHIEIFSRIKIVANFVKVFTFPSEMFVYQILMAINKTK